MLCGHITIRVIEAFIYAVDAAGDNLGTWRVPNAQNVDWEDIAEFKDAGGKCFVYVGDIGNNGGKHRIYSIYRIPEPAVSPANRDTTRKNASETEPAQVLNFDYPEAVHDAETLIVHPSTGDIYVLSKSKRDPSKVFKLTPIFGGDTQTAKEIAEIKVPSIPFGLLTGGDVSNDARRAVLCDYLDGYELTLPAGDDNFDDIWKAGTCKDKPRPAGHRRGRCIHGRRQYYLRHDRRQERSDH